ncbi:type I secretion system permease/ATPase [Methylobacterium gossipiicola]|uniref:Type I secretion system ABC transporter, PrtD family n=1 Tax=Methylobacterium gossipiicola TaxID=582675 RepID=A0A1I2S977_9HYPH|nr:type I secretion system permease/ATPase [Methylobacterium gossipiicola]SFG49310.1 type I secretion system ABC transporter, PrtD family [Methylobacterium gossipiicola]
MRVDRKSELKAALARCQRAFLGVAVMSGVVNVLTLTGSFFMLEVYDRVIPARSIPTLIGLGGLALALFLFQGVIEIIRSRVLARIGCSLDERVAPRVFDAVVRYPLKSPAGGDGLLPLRDLDQIRNFLSGLGPTAFFDLPWLPVYLGVCFLFHPLIGVSALLGAIVLAVLALLTDRLTRRPQGEATRHGARRNELSDAGRHNAEVLHAMGMQANLARVWGEESRAYLARQRRVADIAGGFGAVSKVFRMILQSGVLALGAYLVIQGQATGGIIIASSILVSRALAPAELAIAHWRGFVAAQQGWARLNEILARFPAETDTLALPPPRVALTVEQACLVPPGTQRVVVSDMTFGLKAGQGVGIIGPSASGKSSLARALVGVWAPARGSVRLDGATLDQWSAETLGRHIGYLPQEADLFAGTIASNIARLSPAPDAEAVIAAARTADVHDLILRMPDGYETLIGPGGASLSAGQRQRIGLARALYGNPFLVVLDEPNANLDEPGELALTRAMLSVRARGGIVVCVAHRPSALAAVDLLLVLEEGRARAFGPKDEIMKQMMRPTAVPAPRAEVADARTPQKPKQKTPNLKVRA